MTNQGPPSENSKVIQIPSKTVGSIVGKRGENLKKLQKKSGCYLIQLALEDIPQTN